MKARMLQVMITLTVVCTMARASDWCGADDNGKAATGNWDSDGKPGWNGTGVPNGQGAVARFCSTSKNAVVQNLTDGVTVGSVLLDLPSNIDKNLEIGGQKTVAGPLTFDQDGSGPLSVVVSNGAARARVGFASTAPVTLQDDVLFINTTSTNYYRTASIQLTAPIHGKGNVTLDNAINDPLNAPIVLSSATSTFEGTVLVRRGCAKFINSKACGLTANPVILGAEGFGDATICFEGSAMQFSNPITVSSVTSGRLRIFGEVTASQVTRDCTLTFRNNITLNGDVVFDIPLVMNPDYAQYTNVTYVRGPISGDGALIKENDGSLVLQNTGNTYTGGTVLKAGTLSLESNVTLGTGALDVYPDARLNLASDVTVKSLSIGGRMQRKGVYAAADSVEAGVTKVAWLIGAGKLTATEGKPSGMMIILR